MSAAPSPYTPSSSSPTTTNLNEPSTTTVPPSNPSNVTNSALPNATSTAEIPPPQVALPDPLLTYYLPLLGLVTTPVLALLPPRKLDLYTLCLVSVFGLSAEEFWVGRAARQAQQHRRMEQAVERTEGRDGLLKNARTAERADRDGGAERQKAKTTTTTTTAAAADKAFWTQRQPVFSPGRLDSLGASTPVRGPLGLGHDGRRLLLGRRQQQQQQQTPPPHPRDSHSPTFPSQPFPTNSALPGAGAPVSATAAAAITGDEDAMPLPPRDEHVSTTGAEREEKSRPGDGKEGGGGGGVAEVARKVWYGTETPGGWKQRRMEEEKERFERGESYWDMISEQVGEVFGSKGKGEGG